MVSVRTIASQRGSGGTLGRDASRDPEGGRLAVGLLRDEGRSETTFGVGTFFAGLFLGAGFFVGGAFFAGLFLGAGFFFGGAFFAGLFLGAGFFFGGAFFVSLFLGAGFFFGGAFFAGLFLGAGFFLRADFDLEAGFTFGLPALLDGLRRTAFVPDPLDFGLIYQRYGGLGRLQWGDIIGRGSGPR